MDFSLAIVNIVLLLILFFLATGQLMNAPTQVVDLSNTSLLEIENLPSPTLIIEPDGGLILNGHQVAPELLETALAGQVNLFVLIEGSAPAFDLLDVLAHPALANLEVKLVTVHNSGARP